MTTVNNFKRSNDTNGAENVDLGNNEFKTVWYDINNADQKIITQEVYHLNNYRTRRIYYIDNKPYKEFYYLSDKMHREDGPAEIWYYENGSVYSETYHLNGKELNKQQFEKELLKKKLKLIQ